MFNLATISKMVPRMHIVDGEGLVLFPSAAYVPLSLATVCLMRAEGVRSALLNGGMSAPLVADLKTVGPMREALKWLVLSQAWDNYYGSR